MNADVVSLHVPLTAETRHMISKPQLLKMKPDAILINTSRGAVINEADLAEHCKTHPDFTAGLDVFEYEPVINDDPEETSQCNDGASYCFSNKVDT